MTTHKQTMKLSTSLRRWLACFLSVIILSSSAPGTIFCAQRPARKENSTRKVRLVLGIVIDQFRYDYLTRFEDLFETRGFRRLLQDGAVFTNANYIYLP